MTNFLVSPELVLEGIARERPDSKVDLMCNIVGEVATFILIEKMAGKTVNFPTVAAFKRINKSAYVQAALADKKGKPKQFREAAYLRNSPIGNIIKTLEGKANQN